MNDTTAQLLVDRLAAGLPEPATAPIPELLRDGQRARRRRRRTVVGAAVLAVAVVVAGVVLVPRLGADPRRDPSPAKEMPAPPAGMRWVGYGDDVVAVPESWTTGDAPCDVPQSNTVYVGGQELIDCDIDVVTGLSSMRITPSQADSDAPNAIACFDMFPSTCFGGRILPSGTLLALQVHDQRGAELIQQILDSHIEVPDGWTTVPWPPSVGQGIRNTLVRQGFEVVVVETPNADANAPVSTTPTFGTPVEEGDTIRLNMPVGSE